MLCYKIKKNKNKKLATSVVWLVRIENISLKLNLVSRSSLGHQKRTKKLKRRKRERKKKKKNWRTTASVVVRNWGERKKRRKRGKKKTKTTWFQRFFFSLYFKIPLKWGLWVFFFLNLGPFFFNEFLKIFLGFKQVFNLFIRWADLTTCKKMFNGCVRADNLGCT